MFNKIKSLLFGIEKKATFSISIKSLKELKYFNGAKEISDILQKQNKKSKLMLVGGCVRKLLSQEEINLHKNFVKTILSLAEKKEEIYLVDDQFGSPTYVLDLAKTIIELISKQSMSQMDLLHYSNLGEISWYLFAKKILDWDPIHSGLEELLSSMWKVYQQNFDKVDLFV